MVSGDVDMVNGREGGGIVNGCEVGGWKDSVRGDKGAAAGGIVRP